MAQKFRNFSDKFSDEISDSNISDKFSDEISDTKIVHENFVAPNNSHEISSPKACSGG